MGYCIKLKSYKEIKESDVKSIIFSLPDYLRGPLDEIKEQVWGWPCVCDIHKPKENELIISGSYAMSGDKAQEFTSYIQKELDKMGYDTYLEYIEGIPSDEVVTKDDKCVKLNPKVIVDVPKDIQEVELKPEYNKAVKTLADFSDKAMESFKEAADSLSKVSKSLNKDNCTHCGRKINLTLLDTHYCEKCYQELIIKNSKLQLEMKKRIPEEDVILFMSKLRDLIIKPQTNKYNANDKLKDISELYLKHISKLGGIKYESND